MQHITIGEGIGEEKTAVLQLAFCCRFPSLRCYATCLTHATEALWFLPLHTP